MKQYMLRKNNMITLVLSLIVSMKVSAVECGSFNTKYILNGNTVTASEKLCLRVTKEQTSAFSEKCHMMDKNICPFSKLKKGPAFETFVKPQGSPGFNLCHHIEGSPQLYQIEVNGKLLPYERCFWKDSSEFVDIDYLILYYKSL